MNITTNEDLIAAKTRLTNLKADQAALKLKVMEGEYVPLSEVQARQAEAFTRVKTKLLSLPAKLARKMSNLKMSETAVHALLTQEITEVLNELSVPDDQL